MTTGVPALRALVIYGLCVPLALLVGYLLANPVDWSTIAFFGVVMLVLSAPLLLKWHYPLLVFSLNLSAVAFFLPGRPELWMLVAALSFTMSVLQLTLTRQQGFLHVPSLTKPLLCLLFVVLVTAKLTGGIGFNAFGGENVGGKRYIGIFGAVMIYFALSARRIPPQKAFFYCALFFLSGLSSFTSSLTHFVPSGLYFIFALFPPEAMPGATTLADPNSILRLNGLGVGSVAGLSFLLARYGLRGLLFSGKPWRLAAFLGCVVLSLFGGFRTILVTILFYLVFMAYVEGLFKSRFAPFLALGLVLVVAVGLPFASKLPMSFQRALSVLPVQVSPEAQESARVSSEWRVQIWRDVLPQVPRYLLLGKGFAISAEELSRANASSSLNNQGVMILAGDYHNGPLSTIIPLGIWGVLAFLWLLWAGGRLLYHNLCFGDPTLQTLNTFLFVFFLTKVILFLFVFGSFYSDIYRFTALFGLSVALNGGMCRPAGALARRQVNLKFHGALKPAPSAAGLKPGLSSMAAPPE